MGRVVGLGIAMIVALVSLVDASTYICGNSTKLEWIATVDPSRIPTCPGPFAVSEIPEAQIPAQRALFDSVQKRYLKVVGTAPNALMQEMTQPEKDAVDAPQVVLQAKIDAAKAEVAGNSICTNNSLAQISAYWDARQAELQATITTLDTAITAMTNGTPKTAVTAARNALVAQMTMFIDSSRTMWRYTCSRTVVKP